MKHTLAFLLFLTVAAPHLFSQATLGPCPVFPANNIWNTPIDKLPVKSNSATLVNTIGASKGFHPDFGAGTYNGLPIGIPFNLVSGSAPLIPVTFTYPTESDPGPYRVPLTALVEGGPTSTGDRHVLAVDTTNCVLYEMYYAFPQSTSWKASTGAVWNLRSHALRPSTWTSADAAGLPITPGLIHFDEILAGEIKHAIRFTAPQTKREFVWPARHYASSLTGTQYPRMGERFRLKANFDISTYPAQAQVILKAMKKYGIILSDNGGSWYFQGTPDDRWDNDALNTLKKVLGSNLEAVDATVLMVDPNSGEAKQSTVQVNVTPATATLYVGRGQQFTATVTGTANTAVTWSVDGIAGGNAARGFIDSTGYYMAPSTLPSPVNVVIAANSVASPTVSDSAAVTLSALPNITSVSPSPITTTNFTLTASGAGFQKGAVLKFKGASLPTTWISTSQVRATGTASTSATSVPVVVTNADGTSSNTVYVNVSLTLTAAKVTISPNHITVKLGQKVQVNASVTGAANPALTWKVKGIVGGNATYGTISTTGVYTAPTTHSMAGQVILVTAVLTSDATKYANALVTLAP